MDVRFEEQSITPRGGPVHGRGSSAFTRFLFKIGAVKSNEQAQIFLVVGFFIVVAFNIIIFNTLKNKDTVGSFPLGEEIRDEEGRILQYAQ